MKALEVQRKRAQMRMKRRRDEWRDVPLDGSRTRLVSLSGLIHTIFSE